MAQWRDLPTGIPDKILEYIDDDTWRVHNLSSVSRSWRLTIPGMPRRQLGTIILTPRLGLYGRLEREHGTTIATLLKLAHHSREYEISPNQYNRVDIVTNIRKYQPIRNEADRAYLQGILRTEFVDPRVPF